MAKGFRATENNNNNNNGADPRLTERSNPCLLLR
jgi:hypothetical protein